MKIKVIALLLVFSLQAIALNGDGSAQDALDACDAYAKAEAESIALCKQEVADLTEELVKEQSSHTSPLIYLTVGTILGAAALIFSGHSK